MNTQQCDIYTWIGTPYPLGASIKNDGTNFSVYSKSASRVILNLYESEGDETPSRQFELDTTIHKQGNYWCIWVANIGHGQLYSFDVKHGESSSQHFSSLLDPYAHALVIPQEYNRSSRHQNTNHAKSIKSQVIDHSLFDWGEDSPPKHPFNKTVVYELHVAGFTKHENSGVNEPLRGSYLGLIEKIDYLKALGITAVELMPIQQFDALDAPHDKKNYWGYSPLNFFATHAQYASDGKASTAVQEFKTLVKALHAADIDVILDVVFNHTAEGGKQGPTLGMKGYQADAYYMINGSDYANYSGCGNTINANHSVARRMIMDALHYWVTEMRVDGFRFDLASVLSRDSFGVPLIEPPLLLSIDSDPILSGTKIIAEAWDAGGLYQVGSFVGDRWVEWNGKFRDDVRAFWRGDQGVITAFAQRLMGSPDVYSQCNHSEHRSINFVCAHDGFTLNDLVSYSTKQNHENGENNQDGEHHNLAANYGVEGPTDDTSIEGLRTRQCKNMLVTMFLSLGTPMLNMGDEIRRTQGGNNNAYCQDNAISWMDWGKLEEHADLHRFVTALIHLRTNEPSIEWNTHITLQDTIRNAELEWHGIRPFQPDWANHSHSLAVSLLHPIIKLRMYIVFNAYWEDLTFSIPQPKQGVWHQIIDTGASEHNDIVDIEQAKAFNGREKIVTARSVFVLFEK
ncbi:glycogen debranching enzyme GlgX [Vibrio sp. T187]|uniref:glycogen debranching protein GlgX n=1 Tax=Vibrio TaxID=662 RepID=UPI0010C9A28E|nr:MULTISPECIES: glycogen debranching protein GlgX [Vibrio]MBW3695510.1 glycogen debranching enzyme GlgX [Vibrio sp. T187]